MVWLSPRLLVAFDAFSVSGAMLPGGVGARRVPSLIRIELSDGALAPSPIDDNLVRPAEIRQALCELRRRLGGHKASLILPDGVARMALLDVPRATDPRRFAAFRLHPTLPYAAGEAIVDLLRTGRGRYVAAAVRSRVVHGYEAAAVEAGFVQERVDLAPLVALGALLRRRSPEPAVDLILSDTAVCFAAFDAAGRLRAFRGRRRDTGPDEVDRLREEADRTAVAAGLGPNPRLRAVGTGAPALIRALSFGGRAAQSGWEGKSNGFGVEVAELAWFGAALA